MHKIVNKINVKKIQIILERTKSVPTLQTWETISAPCENSRINWVLTQR